MSLKAVNCSYAIILKEYLEIWVLLYFGAFFCDLFVLPNTALNMGRGSLTIQIIISGNGGVNHDQNVCIVYIFRLKKKTLNI